MNKKKQEAIIPVSMMWDRFAKCDIPCLIRRAVYTEKYLGGNHVHDFAQLWYCLEGEYTHKIGEREYRCRPGSLIIVPPGYAHEYIAGEERPCKLICIEAVQWFFSSLPEEALLRVMLNVYFANFSDELKFSPKFLIELSEAERERTERVLLRLVDSKDARAIITGLERIFMQDSFAFDEKTLLRAGRFHREKFEPMMQAIIYMNKKYSEKIHKEDVIKISCLCQTTFYSMMKSMTGMTFAKYVQWIRITRASVLITFSEFSFSYIADMCGIGNVTYMYRLLRRYRGQRPAEERARRQQRLLEFPYAIITHDFFDWKTDM